MKGVAWLQPFFIDGSSSTNTSRDRKLNKAARPTPTERMKIFGGGRSGNRGGYVKTVLTLAAVGASHPFSGIFWVFQPIFRNFFFVFQSIFQGIPQFFCGIPQFFCGLRAFFWVGVHIFVFRYLGIFFIWGMVN